jgi:hypothetical protein
MSFLAAMDRFVTRQNVDHFRRQLAVEGDPAKRARLETLLHESEQALRDAEAAHAKSPR